MKNEIVLKNNSTSVEKLIKDTFQKREVSSNHTMQLPEILILTTLPTRDCEIAKYSQELIHFLRVRFHELFEIKICALNVSNEQYDYGKGVDYVLDVDTVNSFTELAEKINDNENIRLILIEHEFGFFNTKEEEFIQFLKKLNTSILITFHTVLPKPDESLQRNVQEMIKASDRIIVKSDSSQNILVNDYQVSKDKISVVPI